MSEQDRQPREQVHCPEPELVFVKLGGSVITDKARAETAQIQSIDRLAAEVASALRQRAGLRLLLGHGSGSFGHVAAHRYGTRKGVRSPEEWQGFAKVAAAAAQLDRMVADRFLSAGVPIWSLQPSASAQCRGGQLVSLATNAVEQALAHRLIPLVYGDVALDEQWGGTIISTEQILAFLARRLRPDKLILVTRVDGVFLGDPATDPSARHILEISPANWAEVRTALGGSHATDVTGGMLSKAEEMLNLVQALPSLTVQILSGERAGALETALAKPALASGGTLIHAGRYAG